MDSLLFTHLLRTCVYGNLRAVSNPPPFRENTNLWKADPSTLEAIPGINTAHIMSRIPVLGGETVP